MRITNQHRNLNNDNHPRLTPDFLCLKINDNREL